MSVNPTPGFLEQQASRLCRESIVHRFFSKVKYKGRCVFPDDKVKALNGRPLAMFFYNLRAVFLGFGFIVALALGLWVIFRPSNPEMQGTAFVLVLAWLVDAIVTLYFHKSFIRELDEWTQQPNPNEFPPLFNRYFLLDSVVVFLLIIVGKFWGFWHDAFAFVLFANIVVYSAYFPAVRKIGRFIPIIFFILGIASLLIFVANIPVDEPRLFHILLYAVPLLGMVFVVILSVVMISQMRATEHDITIQRLKLLGAYESKLFPPEPIDDYQYDTNELNISAQQFRKQMTDVLKGMCTLGSPFWYHSACLWFIETHQDLGQLLLPAAWYNFPEAEHRIETISAASGFLGSETLTLLHSIKNQRGELQSTSEDFRHDLDAPAAFIPLFQDQVRVGILALYGEEDGPPLQRQDRAFLKSLGSIISNALQQWESLYQTQPQSEMDELFKSDELVEVFQKTASIMKKYLGAAGCMVVFRPDPNKTTMYIEAKTGISDSIYKTNDYEVGKGLTGQCAATGEIIRIDNVSNHRHKFDLDMLDALEQSHIEEGGSLITSWMAIPIGTNKNYGVIKVINKRLRCSWFSKDDERLGLSLALRLHVIIEKFLFIERMKSAMEDAKLKSDEAQRQSEVARLEKKKAVEAASQRQEDLMVTMHQLQGPLSSMLGSISYLKARLIPKEVLRMLPREIQRDVQEELTNLEDFVKDSMALSYGTFTTFALEVGRQTSFGIHEVNAPEELRKLAKRLQKTNARPDLSFSFYAEPEFPILRMDKKVFTSVLYSLIHNSMKYADRNSEVSLICAKERSTGESVLKVKSIGEPIQRGEKDAIFEKFGRGKVITSTGRHHSGVGLGLWVAKKLMLTVGGDLTVELSPSNPRLSVFIVKIPLSTPGPLAPVTTGSDQK
jgi:signal transduction histidine kinase